MFDIDFVFPYVNNHDDVWIKQYKDYCKRTNRFERLNEINNERFDDVGFLKYLLRGIDKYMPWIHNVFIIVSNIEQVPSFINKEKVKIILHSDIIPAKFLPTYNSTTIEMFLKNIPGLSEHFIYGNDDMYPTNPLTPEDFFTKEGLPKYKFDLHSLNKFNQFSQVCYNNYKDVAKVLNIEYLKNQYLKPEHTLAPMRLSSVIKVCNICAESIYKNLSNFRSSANHNQYIYIIYEILKGYYEESRIIFKYISFKNSLESIKDTIESPYIQITCLNDTSIDNRYQFKKQIKDIEDSFNKKLNNKCKYEI